MTDEIGAYRWRVYDQQDRGGSPRDLDDNYGTLVLSHGSFGLPEEDGTVVGDGGTRVPLPGAQLRAAMITHGLGACAMLREAGALLWVPVWCHTYADGLRFAAAEENPYGDQVDSCLAGLIYVTAANVERVGKPQGGDWQAQFHAAVVKEVRDYDAWFNSEVYRYVVSQYDGSNWLWIEEGRGFYDAAEADAEAQAEIARLMKANVENGDPTGMVSGTRRGVALVREQLTDLAISTRERRAHLATLVDRLARHDPHNPLYVAPDAPHWHGQAHAEADVEAFRTEFHALDWASGVLEQLAEAEHERAAGVAYLADTAPGNDVEQLREALASHARGNDLYGLAMNARKTWEQANAAPFERAPLYASDDEAANTEALRKSAAWTMDEIRGNRDVAVKFWTCSEAECVPREDE